MHSVDVILHIGFLWQKKAQTVTLINTRRYLDVAFNIFNNLSLKKSDIVRALYKTPLTVTSINQFRFTSFNKLVGKYIEASAGLEQHAYRVFHQIHF